MGRKAINLEGQKFGKWTVLKRSDKQVNSKNVYWICQCECGCIKDVCGTDLRLGKSTQCINCYKPQNEKQKLKQKKKKPSIKNNEVGKRYGKLIVLKEAKNICKNATYWNCRCDCGQIINVRIDNLTSGRTKSCGCVKSRGEEKIQKILNDNHILFKREYSFPDLVGVNNGTLRFDFAIFDKNLKLIKLIEYQGRQHYGDIPEKWNDIREHDSLKRKYCKKNNLNLLEIPYTDFNIIDIDYLLK